MTIEATRLLIDRLCALVSRLDFHVLRVHGNIDEFFYMTKIEELTFLRDQPQKEMEGVRTTLKLMGSIYSQAYSQWRKDIRWLIGNNRAVRRVESRRGFTRWQSR